MNLLTRRRNPVDHLSQFVGLSVVYKVNHLLDHMDENSQVICQSGHITPPRYRNWILYTTRLWQHHLPIYIFTFQIITCVKVLIQCWFLWGCAMYPSLDMMHPKFFFTMKRHDCHISFWFRILGKLVYPVKQNLPVIQPYPLPDTSDEISNFTYWG